MHIRKNDLVKVLSGVDRTKAPARVVKVNRAEGTAIVQGRNMVWKHLRRSQDYPHGARVQKEAPIPVSKLMPIDPSDSKPARVNYKKSGDGKERVSARTGKPFGGEA
jgi:large subunit ribosomal protein L24